jgi:hypothetical protein
VDEMNSLTTISEAPRAVQVVNDLATALAKAQSEIKHAVKDSSNPFFKSSYADLASVWEACRAPLSKHGLSVTQTTDVLENGQAVLITTLLHSSGQYIQGRYPLNPIKNDPQAMGSAVTYARRYTLQAIVGIAPDDDDAEAAMARDAKAAAIHETVTQEKPEAKKIDKPGDFIVPFGKYANKKISELTPETVQQSIDYWLEREKSDGKPLSGKVKNFVEACRAYLASK